MKVLLISLCVALNALRCHANTCTLPLGFDHADAKCKYGGTGCTEAEAAVGTSGNTPGFICTVKGWSGAPTDSEVATCPSANGVFETASAGTPLTACSTLSCTTPNTLTMPANTREKTSGAIADTMAQSGSVATTELEGVSGYSCANLVAKSICEDAAETKVTFTWETSAGVQKDCVAIAGKCAGNLATKAQDGTTMVALATKTKFEAGASVETYGYDCGKGIKYKADADTVAAPGTKADADTNCCDGARTGMCSHNKETDATAFLTESTNDGFRFPCGAGHIFVDDPQFVAAGATTEPEQRKLCCIEIKEKCEKNFKAGEDTFSDLSKLNTTDQTYGYNCPANTYNLGSTIGFSGADDAAKQKVCCKECTKDKCPPAAEAEVGASTRFLPGYIGLLASFSAVAALFVG